jgi:SulP family sulfate permease
MMHNPKSDVAVLITTLVLTVIFDLTIAIEVGLVMAILLFMKRVMASTHITVIRDQMEVHHDGESHDEQLTIPESTEVYEIEGPFFFGIANKFDEAMRRVGGNKSLIRVVRMRKVTFVDSTGIHNLEIFIRQSQKENRKVILSGVSDSVYRTLEKAGVCKLVGEENVCNHIDKALARANEIIESSKSKE